MTFSRIWKHRARVYKHGDAWYWECYRECCAAGPAPDQGLAYTLATTHAFLGGYTYGPE